MKHFFKIVIILFWVSCFQTTQGQLTTSIGSGNDEPYFTQFSPVFWFSPSISFTNTRSNILFTQDEMAAAGIPPGATITAVEFNKLTIHTQVAPSVFSMMMKNTINTALDPTTATWADISSSFTPVYLNSSFNLPAVAGWTAWNLQTPFLYSGGALEIATENSTAGGNTPTGNVAWEWTSGTPQSTIIGSFNYGSFDNSFNAFRSRPNIKITYYPPACTTPSPATINNITNTTADIVWNAVNGAIGYQYAITTDPIPPASGLDTPSNSIFATGLDPLTQYYVHVRSNCGSGYSLFWKTTAFNTLEPCPRPSIPDINVNASNESGYLSWHPSPFGASGYEYLLSTSSVQPTSGILTTDTSFDATGLLGSAQYYVHVRANCNALGFSPWVSKSFITPCFIPAPVVTSNIKPGVVDFIWQQTGGTKHYEYSISTVATPPLGGSAITDTIYSSSDLHAGLTYYFHVRSYCGSGVSPWTTVKFNPLGLEVFPNPVKEVLQIKLHGINNSNGQIAIADITGKIVRRFNLIGNSATIDTRRWYPGVYIIHYNERGNKYTVKIIKQ